MSYKYILNLTMWIKRRNCFDSDEEYEKYLEKYEEENSDRRYEIEMGWRDSDGYPLVAHL